jgi:hypothetical protein
MYHSSKSEPVDGEPESLCNRPRFVDLHSEEAAFFNLLLGRDLLDSVVRWDCCEHIGRVFGLEDVILNIENAEAETVIV